METLDFWFLYIITVFIASIIPGPSMILALTHGLKYGAKVSMITAFGNSVASIIQATIAITGLSIILTTSTLLFMIIKYAGAIYLIYLGIKLFKTPFHIEDDKNLDKNSIKPKKLFMEAFIVASSNPKALIFFTALFPQFINSANSNFMHYLMLVTILGFIAFMCMMIYSTSAYFIKDLFNKTSLSKYFGKAIGSLFVSFGIGLALVKK